jgi:exonuclease SbcD
MAKFRFIHAADIHLGSFLNIDGVEVHSKLQELSRAATYRAFDHICQVAIQSKSKFILISGDLYDRESRSVHANRYFVDSCKKLQKEEVRVLVTAGNHDPVKEHGEIFELPDNVHIFRQDIAEMITVNDEDGEPIAVVSGQSYGGRQETSPIHQQYPVTDNRIFRIAMLHTQLESPKSTYVPATLGELTQHSGFDYWALGHIHHPCILNDEGPVVAYSGAPQGRDFGEQGPGGCWLVEVDEIKGIHMEYQLTSPVIYKNIFVDIGCPELREADSLDKLEDYLITKAQEVVQEAAFQHGNKSSVEGYIARWEIGGRGKLHYYLSEDLRACEQVICQALRETMFSQTPFIWTNSVVIRTANPVGDTMRNRHPLLRELLDQTILSLKQNPELRADLISNLGQAWTTNLDPEDQDDESLPLDQKTLESIVEDATYLILEGLAEGGEG